MIDQDTALINAYLGGSLSKKDLLIFNKKMSENEAFKKQVNFEIQMQESLSDSQWSFIEDVENEKVLEYKKIIDQQEIQELKETLRNLFENKKPKTKKNHTIWYGIAAILVVSISLFSLLNKSNGRENLYTYYLEDTDIPSLVVRSENQSSLNKIQQSFEDKKYDESINLINDSLLFKSQSSGNLLIIKGISQLEINKTKEAISTFDSLINSDLVDGQKGYWFKALVYLKLDDFENCKDLLLQITEKKLYNYSKAKELLKELE